MHKILSTLAGTPHMSCIPLNRARSPCGACWWWALYDLAWGEVLKQIDNIKLDSLSLMIESGDYVYDEAFSRSVLDPGRISRTEG